MPMIFLLISLKRRTGNGKGNGEIHESLHYAAR